MIEDNLKRLIQKSEGMNEIENKKYDRWSTEPKTLFLIKNKINLFGRVYFLKKDMTKWKFCD